MKKLFTFCIFFICFFIKAKADHITGGEMYYTYYANADGTFTYNVTFKLFMRCYSNRQFYDPTIVSVFDKGTNQRVTDVSVPLFDQQTLSLTDPDPCVTNPPQVCFIAGYYNFTLTLPPSPNGYILSSQVNFRIAGINNLTNGYRNIGAMYTAEIPGTSQVTNGPQNNSARFAGNDLVVVCAENRFSYSFGATDKDGDQLRYSFCDAYQSGYMGVTVSPTPPPPFVPVPYGNNFSSSAPLGGTVQINSSTGLITGIAPQSGIYVITVCVEEIRNGKVIGTQRKDLQINIAPCNVAAAILQPEYSFCKSSTTISLVNLSTSPLIQTYFWQLTDKSGTPVYTSSNPAVNYTFADTGTYNIKLVINRGAACTDSTTSLARVYPGFVPDFNYTGVCFNKPTAFTDATTTVYGSVNSWNWAFGTGDISDKQNPSYTYVSMGSRNVQLIVTNTKGCRDTVTKAIPIVDKPPVNLAFKDTLICAGDPLTLLANGTGIFSWTPNVNAINTNTPNPTVTPSATTTYTANLNDNGCLNADSVLVRVTDHVNLRIMPDTTICSGDTIQLRVVSDAFKYSWSPANQIINAGAASPIAVTNSTTAYHVTANIGSCQATAKVTVATVPYPYAYAGKDTTICFKSTVQLNGQSDGKTVSWTPSLSLSNAQILNPVATPATTIAYQLSAYDTKGCPKPGIDTVVVTVLPVIQPYAGTDTSVIVEQSLQLHSTGGIKYVWSPDIGLSATNIADPVAQYSEPSEGILYKVLVYNLADCVDSAFITVKVFNTGPSVFVPSAFTPNGDGKNDLLRPIAVGMKQIEFFSIYNRWGQLIFTTRANGSGWDGTINGIPQATGVYVWMVKASTYNGVSYFRKGTVTLIK